MIKRFKEKGTLISFDVNFRSNLWTGAEAKECIEEILPYVDIFFCSEDTARLTFLKTGNVKEILKSFTEEYPISIVAATQRIVHSPKSHTFGSIVYDARKDEYYEEEPYRNIEVVDRIGSGDAYISGALYGLLSSDMDCKKAMEYGNATASVKNTIPGDLLSTSLIKSFIFNILINILFLRISCALSFARTYFYSNLIMSLLMRRFCFDPLILNLFLVFFCLFNKRNITFISSLIDFA